MKETRYIAFRCPDCGVALIQEVTLFSLSSGEVVRRCSCGESALRVKYIKNRDTVSLDVPCIACPKAHPYQVSAKTFFGDDMFVLQCTDSGLDIFFVGDREEIVKAVEQNTLELQKLFELIDREEHGQECEDDECECHRQNENNVKTDEYEYYDAVVTSGMLYLLKELADSDKINCPCGKKELILDVGYDVMEISCDACQARQVLRAMTDEDIVALAQKETLELE